MRIAVISPFLDRSHGTERAIIEQLERIPPNSQAEIHLYSQWVQDLQRVRSFTASETTPQQWGIVWHKVPKIAGPHLFQFLFWFYANRRARRKDQLRQQLNFDLVYSPGINASDADAITVHIVFQDFYRRVLPQLSFRVNPIAEWPRLLHRRLYYRLIMSLEESIYSDSRVSLAAVSALVASQLHEHFQRSDVQVIRNAVDTVTLNPARRLERRDSSRRELEFRPQDFAFLLIGNDWKKKGLEPLIRACAEFGDKSWKLLVVGSDARSPYEKLARELGVGDRVCFLSPNVDVLKFYAVADVYVGPSLEDAYGLPVLEAMACGLPVIASSQAGVSEIIRHGENGLILSDPLDVDEIKQALRSLLDNPELRRRLGEEAHRTAQGETWERNAQQTWAWLTELVNRRRRASS